MKLPVVYILADEKKSNLTVGITSELNKCIAENKLIRIEQNTQTPLIDRLVYFEIIEEIATANEREKELKNWDKRWKEKLINDFNPCWEDLSINIFKNRII